MKKNAVIGLNHFYATYLLIFSILLILTGAAQGAELDTVRPGDDIQILEMPLGATPDQCAHECRNDPRCRSWTFVRERASSPKGLTFRLGKDFSIQLGGGKTQVRPAQCRLKSSVPEAYQNKCCVSGVIKVARQHANRKAERCDNYAQRSVAQQDKNLAQRCGLRGSGWHSRYQKHFDWCMNANRESRRLRVQDRTDALAACTQSRKRRNTACEDYADQALLQAQANANDKCGYRGSDWRTDFQSHYDWCLNASEKKRRQKRTRRAKQISACQRRGGGPDIPQCDDYAKQAIAQNKRNTALNCGLSGNLWGHTYAEYYQWCLNKGPRKLTGRTERRKEALQQCKRQKAACDAYARRALSQAQANRDNRCGYKGPNWRLDSDTHYRWCRSVDKLQRENQIAWLNDKIAVCQNRGGGPYIEKCAVYAKNAMAQNARNAELNCGLTGKLWGRTYAQYYQWCADKRPRRLRKRTERRQDALQQCRSDRAACDAYVRRALTHVQTNRDNRCGYKGPNWRLDSDTHYRWCRSADKLQRKNHITWLEDQIAVCQNRGGGPYIEKCAVYAKNAMAQNARNAELNCGLTGKLWGRTYAQYYQWCADKRPRRLQKRTERRRDALQQCRSGRASCDTYVRRALTHVQANRDNRCGYKGPNWRLDSDTHYRWCRSADKLQRKNHITWLEDQIAICQNRGGGPYIEKCAVYAKNAMAQNARNAELNCGLTGNLWGRTYAQYYQWCADKRPRRLQKRTERRRDALQQCRLAKAKPKPRRKPVRRISGACEKFVAKMLLLDAENRARGCYQGGDWNGTRQSYLNYCKRANPQFRAISLEQKAKMLARCRVRQ